MSANKEFSELFKIAYSYPELYLNFIKNAYTPFEDFDRKMDKNADAQIKEYAENDPVIKAYSKNILSAEEDELEDMGRKFETVLQGKINMKFSDEYTLDTMEKFKKAVSRYVEALVSKARSKSTTASFNENMSILHNALAEEFSKKTASADKRKYAQVFDLLSHKDINEHLRRKYAEAQSRPFLVTVTCETWSHEDAEHGEISQDKRYTQVQEELSEKCVNLDELRECLEKVSLKYRGWSNGEIQLTSSSVSVDLMDPEPGDAHSRRCNIQVTCTKESCKEVAHLVSKFFS